MLALREAIIAAAAADTGTGSLVALVGADDPVWWRRRVEDEELPRVVYRLLPGGWGTMRGKWTRSVQFEIWVKRNSSGTELTEAEDIRDRLLDVMTAATLAANGVNCARTNVRVFELEPDDRAVGLGAEMTYMNAA